ncbi:integrase arm-type DNA-binding domain-containing protein [Sphingobium sufflavum]|uniref:tyrosine-type recombinase/integrase n=1 Tax=Sphingobium sufflavum TaxID=1129547 RepID=UPI001F194DD5|nr:integrase arm-type DNA-binding domain-containing protein [Sphingobium sufflavum]MCE7795360.1 integrase arm-type DNA-binding domain-containing protein [Sphingobium sufflavum]
MRARNKLNLRQIASLTKPGIYSDGGGLHLRVRTSGSRSWVYIFRMNGQRREMGLGSDLDVTLAKAREKASVVRELVQEGIDPQKARLVQKADKPERPPVTFGEAAIDLIDSLEEGFKNPKHRQQWRNTLVTYATSLWAIPVAHVTTEDVLAVLKPIWTTKAETASRVQQRVQRVLEAAKVKGLRSGDNPAAWRGHLELLLPKKSKASAKHHAALPFGEIAGFMRVLADRPAVAARALEFTILTAARSGETRGMTWGEVDFERKLWTVPAERMKAGTQHEVPLSDAALGVLQGVRPKTAVSDKLVFVAPRGGQFSDMAMSQLLKRMDRDDITVHGFRSTFRDWAGECTARL